MSLYFHIGMCIAALSVLSLLCVPRVETSLVWRFAGVAFVAIATTFLWPFVLIAWAHSLWEEIS